MLRLLVNNLLAVIWMEVIMASLEVIYLEGLKDQKYSGWRQYLSRTRYEPRTFWIHVKIVRDTAPANLLEKQYDNMVTRTKERRRKNKISKEKTWTWNVMHLDFMVRKMDENFTPRAPKLRNLELFDCTLWSHSCKETFLVFIVRIESWTVVV